MQEVDNLVLQTEQFKKHSHELKEQKWWENFSTQVMVVCIVLALIGLIVGIIVAVNTHKTSSSSSAIPSLQSFGIVVGHVGNIETSNFTLTGIAAASAFFAFVAIIAGTASRTESYCDCDECRAERESMVGTARADGTIDGVPNEETPLLAGAEV